MPFVVKCHALSDVTSVQSKLEVHPRQADWLVPQNVGMRKGPPSTGPTPIRLQRLPSKLDSISDSVGFGDLQKELFAEDKQADHISSNEHLHCCMSLDGIRLRFQ